MYHDITLHLEDSADVTVDVARWQSQHTTLRIDDVMLVFPMDPERADGICDDLIDCLNEIKVEQSRLIAAAAALRHGGGIPDRDSATYRRDMAQSGRSAMLRD